MNLKDILSIYYRQKILSTTDLAGNMSGNTTTICARSLRTKQGERLLISKQMNLTEQGQAFSLAQVVKSLSENKLHKPFQKVRHPYQVKIDLLCQTSHRPSASRSPNSPQERSSSYKILRINLFGISLASLAICETLICANVEKLNSAQQITYSTD